MRSFTTATLCDFKRCLSLFYTFPVISKTSVQEQGAACLPRRPDGSTRRAGGWSVPAVNHVWRSLAVRCLIASLVTLSGCAGEPFRETRLIGRNEHYAVVMPGSGETSASLAERFLGDPRDAWRIEDANPAGDNSPGEPVVIPLTETNPLGVFHDRIQVVPILSYHRFGAGRGRLSVSAEQFTEQMDYLRKNGYRVVSLERLLGFLLGHHGLPQRAVVLTIDDGYRSVYEIAYPILKRFGYPATIFVYSDYIGNGGVTWAQMREMAATGLFTFQSHSKTHGNLAKQESGESTADYARRLQQEVRVPREAIRGALREPVVGFAYPFGAVNAAVAEAVREEGYQLAFTVQRGANPFYAHPFLLRRNMIYATDGIEDFARALEAYESGVFR
jgi:peptidoglycan/xylan/chitin deacetylase (PgdA/CDA1 family)